MKNKAWNKKLRIRLMAAGLAGALSLGLWGCNGADSSSASGQVSQEAEAQESTEQPGDTQGKSSSESGMEAAEGKASAAAGEQEVSEDEGQGTDELYGEIREVSAQTFVLSRAMEEEAGDGTEIVMLPVEEGEMELVTVAWDDNTKFVKRTYRNGGEDYEDSESSPEALETGAMPELQGSCEGDTFRASQVCLIE